MRAGCFVFQGQRVVARTFAALTPPLRVACGPPRFRAAGGTVLNDHPLPLENKTN